MEGLDSNLMLGLAKMYEKISPNTVIQGDTNTVLQLAKEFAGGNACNLFKVVEGVINIVDVINGMYASGYKMRFLGQFRANDDKGFDIFFDVGQKKVCEFTMYMKNYEFAYRVAVICVTLP